MKMTSFRCYDYLGRPGFAQCRTRTVIFLSYVTLWSLVTVPRVADGNFNLYMDRHEVHRLLGLSSDIYLVREGVVNEYALNFVVNVPSQVEKLHFSWQSLIKKPIHYELAIEFADFIALLPPSSNISTKGRIPQQLETFRIILPCSGRLSTEVSVIIRFTFHLKSPKHNANATQISVRRNKICLTKEFSGLENRQSSSSQDTGGGGGSSPTSKGNVAAGEGASGVGVGGSGGHSNPNPGINNINGNNGNSNNSTMFIFQDPTPSLLLAGLLGGCAVTASTVFLTFFICLRRKLVPSSSSDSSYSSTCPGQSNMDPNTMSNNSSPACLLRQNQSSDSKWITLPGSHSGSNSSTKENFCSNNLLVEPLGSVQPYHLIQHQHQNPQQQLGQHAHILRSNSPMTRSWSRNSYVTIASFWNDIFTTGIPGGQQQQQIQHQQSNNCHNNSSRGSKVTNSTFLPGNRTSTNSNNTSSTTTKGSDVSPYAYAHILGIPSAPPPMMSSLVGSGSKLGTGAGVGSALSQNQTQQPSSISPSPHILEWYAQTTQPPPPPPCSNLPGGGHIYSNHLYTFNPSPNNSPFMTAQQQHQLSSPKHNIMSVMSPLPPPIPPNTSSLSPNVPPPPPPPPPYPGLPKTMGNAISSSASIAIGGTNNITHTTSISNPAPLETDCAASIDGNSSTAGHSGSESIIQIDGWQCRKNYTKETDVVERFL